MPGGDGTGPAGMGPMTGRAAGYCAGYPVPGYANPIAGGRGGFGFGRGWGRGRGRGFGRGWGRGGWGYAAYPNYGYGYPQYAASQYASGPELTAKDEAGMLREEAKAVQEELKAINARVKELEKEK